MINGVYKLFWSVVGVFGGCVARMCVSLPMIRCKRWLDPTVTLSQLRVLVR